MHTADTLLPARPQGRYVDAARYSTDKGAGEMLPQNGPDWRNREIVEAAVQSTSQGDRRARVAVNGNTDVLEREHSHGNISNGAYHSGLAYQMILERADGVNHGSGGGGARVDQCYNSDWPVLVRIMAARNVNELLDDTRKITGEHGARVLGYALRERRTLTEIAGIMTGTADKATVKAHGIIFRMCLENLARHWNPTRVQE